MRVSIESWVIMRQEGNLCSLLGKKPSFIRHSRDLLVHSVSEAKDHICDRCLFFLFFNHLFENTKFPVILAVSQLERLNFYIVSCPIG